jgi:hypothetical protein
LLQAVRFFHIRVQYPRALAGCQPAPTDL